MSRVKFYLYGTKPETLDFPMKEIDKEHIIDQMKSREPFIECDTFVVSLGEIKFVHFYEE